MTRARTRADADDDRDPTPRGRSAPIRLATAEDIRKELGRVYRQARRGQIATSEATRLAYLLDCMRKAIETDVLAAQVAELERLYGHHDGVQRPGLGGGGAVHALPSAAGKG